MYSDGRHQIELSLLGEGIQIKKIAFTVNDFGETHYRFQENGEVSRFAVDASIYYGRAEFAVHTWNAEGKHVELIHENDLSDGALIEKDGEADIDGKVYRYHFTLHYSIQSNMSNDWF